MTVSSGGRGLLGRLENAVRSMCQNELDATQRAFWAKAPMDDLTWADLRDLLAEVERLQKIEGAARHLLDVEYGDRNDDWRAELSKARDLLRIAIEEVPQ